MAPALRMTRSIKEKLPIFFGSLFKCKKSLLYLNFHFELFQKFPFCFGGFGW